MCAIAMHRATNYRGEGAVYSTVEELIELRETGVLIGPSAAGTYRDWTGEESADIKTAYRAGEFTAQIRRLFPLEAQEVDDAIANGD